MTDSGQQPAEPLQPDVPDSGSPSETPEPTGTKRLIPVPPPTTPPPPYGVPAAKAAGDSTPPRIPGESYIGKYRIKGQLGRGGMGTVYLAEQPGLAREVAIKALVPSAAADPVSLTRFLQEAQVMARASHPNLVQVHDIELMGDVNYIVLEYVRGRSLRDWMGRGPIPPPQVFAVMHGVLQALDYAHRRGIVHRDMKPENVLLSDEGVVKVADFGIARLTDDPAGGGTTTKTGTTVGTPQYMSPEQVASSKVDGRSDLYSAGIVFYELVAGEPPFMASESDGPFTLMAKHVQAPPTPPSVYQPGLNPELERVILTSIAKRPEDRYQTGQEFDAAMSRIADQMCPGWGRSLEPGADLSRMVAVATPPTPIPSSQISHQEASTPPQSFQVVYNPAPPIKPAAKRTISCLSVLASLFGAVAVLGLLASNLH